MHRPPNIVEVVISLPLFVHTPSDETFFYSIFVVYQPRTLHESRKESHTFDLSINDGPRILHNHLSSDLED